MDEASRSAAKTPAAARQLIAQHTSAVASISVQQLTETWQAQIEYLQEATVSRQLKADGKRSTIRLHVFKGMGVLQKLLGQANTQQRTRAGGVIEAPRPDTEGGQVSVPIPSPMPAMPCA
jgi:hypothetical protein